MRGRAGFAMACLVALASPTRADEAAPGRTLKQSVQRYKDALAKVRWAASDGNLAALYQRAREFDLETDPTLAAELEDFLDHASPPQKASLMRDLEGLILDARKDARARPDLGFFLATSRKGKADQSETFFELALALHPEKDSSRPAYLQPTAAGRCARFGEGLLPEFLKQLRKRRDELFDYRPAIAAEDAALVQVLLTSPCACGDRDAVLKELRRVLKSFPDDKTAPAIRDRIKAIEDGTADQRFGACGG